MRRCCGGAGLPCLFKVSAIVTALSPPNRIVPSVFRGKEQRSGPHPSTSGCRQRGRSRGATVALRGKSGFNLDLERGRRWLRSLRSLPGDGAEISLQSVFLCPGGNRGLQGHKPLCRGGTELVGGK